MTDPALIAPLAEALADEAASLVSGAPPPVELSPPARAEHGDLATPLSLSLAGAARRPPREIAEELATGLRRRDELAALLERVEVAGPGFLNLTLSPAWFSAAARAVAEAGAGYGAGQAEPRERILLEFVSSNPTGPPHAGHARHGAYGDSLARILDFAGHTVWREFYVNDYGRQMELFGASLAARFGELLGRPVEMPEDGYLGDYLVPLAERIGREGGDRYAEDLAPLTPEALRFFAHRGCEAMMEATQADLERFRVSFDAFFFESSLHEGMVAEGLSALESSGDAYHREGALWFRTSAYGDEKDRVLRRRDGSTTYLAADVAYHLEKAGRGFDRLIDVLGADHHGYVERLRAVLAAGGTDPERLEVPIVQLVSLVERGEARRMSKRAGTLVTLRELVDDIGVDAARFFLVQRSHETPFDLDLDLAREQSQENPVYYVQYAHARVASIMGRLDGEPPADVGPPASLDPSERALVLRLAEWPEAVGEAAERRAPHRVVAYLVELARDFHGFYHRCRVLGEPPEVEAFRLDCCRAVGVVVRTGLGLVGVEAPDHM